MTTDIRIGEYVRAEGDEIALAGLRPWSVASLFAGPDGLGDGSAWVSRVTTSKGGLVQTEARRLLHYLRTDAPPVKK